MRGLLTLSMSAAAVALLAAGCGAANGDGQRSAPRKKAGAGQSELNGFMDNGGVPGCYDPRQITGYKRSVMERMGSKPCTSAPKSAAATTAATGASWPGTYRGPFVGGTGTLTIATTPGRTFYRVALSVKGGVCTMQGVGAVQNNALSIEIPTSADAGGADEQGLCVVSIRRTAGGMRVSEEDCAPLHGKSCGFSGTASRVQ